MINWIEENLVQKLLTPNFPPDPRSTWIRAGHKFSSCPVAHRARNSYLPVVGTTRRHRCPNGSGRQKRALHQHEKRCSLAREISTPTQTAHHPAHPHLFHKQRVFELILVCAKVWSFWKTQWHWWSIVLENFGTFLKHFCRFVNICPFSQIIFMWNWTDEEPFVRASENERNFSKSTCQVPSIKNDFLQRNSRVYLRERAV